MIIAIDGMQAVGKTQTAKELAKLLGGTYVNSGAIYKMWALKGKEEAFKYPHYDQYLEINTPENLEKTSKLAEEKEVRDAVNGFLRDFVKKEGVFILEGRDMAQVFPHADWKFFIDADIKVKARRYMKVVPDCTVFEEALQQVKDLDFRDMNRKVAPLKMADDAVFYDNSESPSAFVDAAVLWHYLKNWKQIKDNVLRRS